MKVKDLNKEYDKLQIKYGSPELDSIYNGGLEENPDICFVFMNPTGKNLASQKSWKGRKSPWISTKNIWKLFFSVGLLDEKIYNEIMEKKPKDWDYSFADQVYEDVKKHKIFITNLGKCTQIDARPLSDDVLKQYLSLLEKEIDIIRPKVIITLGNQVSSIVLDRKISVSQCRKMSFIKEINDIQYKVFPIFYPVGNGIFNMDKSIEDIKWIMEKIC
ncbi:MAG: uracil-DNA glycosylase family protein [Clostridia bacterium]